MIPRLTNLVGSPLGIRLHRDNSNVIRMLALIRSDSSEDIVRPMAAVAALWAWALLAHSGGTVAATLVNTGEAQCCSSIAPQMPPATYYGATMRREEDLAAMTRPFPVPFEDPPGSVDELQALVVHTETERGPVALELADPLRALAAAHFAEGKYAQGIAALKRGIHVLRLNEGLHAPDQTALLEQLIGAYIRLGDYSSADAQQNYLYRILAFRRDHAVPELREATLRYADWMRGAYIGDLGRQRFPRLVDINDLYADAMQEIEDKAGQHSRELLPFLEGRAQLSYLISVYPGEERAGIRVQTGSPRGMETASEAQLRFWRMEKHNFRYGQQALQRRVEIYAHDPDSTAEERATALVELADWYQWNRQYARAIQAYEEAWSIAQGGDNAVRWLQETFVEPLELPRTGVFAPGVVPIGTLNNAEVLMRFDVSRHGEAKDITVLSEDTRETKSATTRAYHYLRNLRFRPRLTEGSVVRAENVERRYGIKY